MRAHTHTHLHAWQSDSTSLEVKIHFNVFKLQPATLINVDKSGAKKPKTFLDLYDDDERRHSNLFYQALLNLKVSRQSLLEHKK